MENEVRIYFVKMLERIEEETRNTEYVETHDKILEFLDRETFEGTVFDAAFELHERDADKKMSESVFKFLYTVYQFGIDEGHPICMNNMGCLYYTNRCGMQDYKKAMGYYTMAAEKGYPLAASNLGYFYYYGLDTEVNYELAYKYFTMGALRGEIEAIYKVGDMFRYGYYVEKSPRTAFCMYNRAYNMLQETTDIRWGGYVLKRMGDAVSEGIGVEPDNSAALSFYQSAEIAFYDQIKHGDPFVQKDLEFVKKAQTKLRKRIMKELPELEWKLVP